MLVVFSACGKYNFASRVPTRCRPFKSRLPKAKEKGHPKGCPFLLVGEAGLEPARPQ